MRIFDDVVLLEYRRENDAYTFAGSITIKGQHEEAFQGASFVDMLERAGAVLRQYLGYRLILKRGEAPYPMALPENIEELLRDDTAEAIRRLTIPPQRIEIRDRPTRGKKDTLLGELRHGFDTLADALGDELYLRLQVRRDGSWAEDPASGRWLPVSADQLCGNLRIVEVSPYRGAWCTARTSDVLALGLGRYYLPRRWNPSRGWISHTALVEMYETYQKEKADATSTRSDDSAESGLPA